MKKLLILIFIALLLTLSIFIVINGLKIGNLKILGIQEIQTKNAELDAKISQATKLASTDYRKALAETEENMKKLEQEKTDYQDMITVSTSKEVQTANQFEKYEVEYLWTKLGNHATSEGVTIKVDIVKGNNTTEGTYNLKFSVQGSYIGVTDYIYAIENDSSLGFKIEEFKMIPNIDTSELLGTFTCKDIAIKNITQTTQKVGDDTSTTNNTNNTTNNTTKNTTKNTTNNTKNTTNNKTNNTTNNTTDNTNTANNTNS